MRGSAGDSGRSCCRRCSITAESRGITRFLAYVLADNQRMLRLIGRLGTVTERSLDQGIVTLRFTPRPDAPPAEPASTLGNSG